MLGLALRAGRLVSGEFSTEKAVKDGRARLVVVAADASDNTRKLFLDKCRSYSVPVRIYADKASLGKALGAEYRASCALTDEGFAKAVLERLDALKADGKENRGDQNI